MKKRMTFLTASVLAVTAAVSAAPSAGEVKAVDTVSIMPIGDSITFGYGDEGGYRKFLDGFLHEKGITFDMVGPEGSNSASFNYNGKTVTYDDNHAGYSGYTICQQYPIPSWGENGLYEVLKKKDAVSKAQPDIVLLMIGTNDMTANRDLTECAKDLRMLLNYILDQMPMNGMIFLASIPEFTAYGGNAQRVANYNDTVKSVAEEYSDNVRFADVHGCLNGMADMASDNLHPSSAGYEKIGKFWSETIADYLSGAEEPPFDPDQPEILHSDFENGLSGWKSRGGAGVAVTTAEAAEGKSSAAVTDRDASWKGIAYSLSSTASPAGSLLSIKAQVMQKSGKTVHFKMTMQYDSGDAVDYDTFAEGNAASGEWITLSAANYQMKDGKNPVLYFETDTELCDFYLDDVTVTRLNSSDVVVTPPANLKKGDLDANGKVEAADAALLMDYLLGKKDSLTYAGAADLDEDTVITAKDLSLLKQAVLNPKEPEETHDTEYMSKIRNQITATVPSSALAKTDNKVEHITYFSKTANRDKGANVWLPPGYDKNKQYPVFYVNHGYGGDEGSMVNGMGVCEIATNLINSGEAEPMIIVFTDQYSDPAHPKQTGNGQADVPGYDLFVEDMPGSLMPYIESHYPVKTGRENTAIAGFSMGGRESLYIGMKCCDKIGYIGGGAPAPGIFPTQDQFMTHPGVMSKDEIRIDPPYSPYVLMIAGGTNDGMVNDFPKQYSDLFTQHGTENIYISVPGGGHDSSTVIPLMYNFIRCLFKA